MDFWNLETVSGYTSQQEIRTGEDNCQESFFNTSNNVQQLELIANNNNRSGKRFLIENDHDLSAKKFCNFESENNLVVTSCVETNDVPKETIIVSENQSQSSTLIIDDKKELNKKLKIINNRANLLYKDMKIINSHQNDQAINVDYSYSINSGAYVTEEHQKPLFQARYTAPKPNVSRADMNNKKLEQKKIEQHILNKALQLAKDVSERMKNLLTSRTDQLNPTVSSNNNVVSIDLDKIIESEKISFEEYMTAPELPKIVITDNNGSKVATTPILTAALFNQSITSNRTQSRVSQRRRRKNTVNDSNEIKLEQKRQENIKIKTLKNMASSLKIEMDSLINKETMLPIKLNLDDDNDLNFINNFIESLDMKATSVTTHSTEVTQNSSNDPFVTFTNNDSQVNNEKLISDFVSNVVFSPSFDFGCSFSEINY